MAVTVDAAGPSSSGAGSAFSTALSWSHTCGASATYLLAGVWESNASDLAMTATYNGVSMTSLGVIDGYQPGAGRGFLQVWALANPPVSAAHNVAVAVAGGTPSALSGGSVSFAGAAALGTPALAQSWGTAAAATVTGTASSSLVAAFCGVDSGGTFTSTGPAASQFMFNPGGTAMCAAETTPGGGSVTSAWTVTSAPWGVIAVEVQAAAAAAAQPSYLPRQQAIVTAATR